MSYATAPITDFAVSHKALTLPFNWRLALALGFNAAVWAGGLASVVHLARGLNLI
jgi:hypothetical protein